MLQINLIRWRSIQRRHQFLQLILLLLVAVFVGVVMLSLSYQTLNKQVQQEASKRNRASLSLNNIVLHPENQRGVLNQLQVYQQHYNKVTQVIGKHRDMHRLFEVLDNLVPRQVSLIQITYHNQILKLKGISHSNAALSDFLSELSKLSAFKSPKVSFSLQKNQNLSSSTTQNNKQFELQVLFLKSNELNSSKGKV